MRREVVHDEERCGQIRGQAVGDLDQSLDPTRGRPDDHDVVTRHEPVSALVSQSYPSK
jgi:hypothetical protein